MPRPAVADRPTTSLQLSLFDAPPAERPAAPAPLPPPVSRAEFRHPQADRELQLDGHLVAFALRRARRRSIGFVVGTEGLSVNAPRWVTLADIERALRDKSAWILRKLAEQRERGQRLQAARVDWRDGTCLPYLGGQLVIVLDPKARGAVLHPGVVSADDGTPAAARLHIGAPQGAGPGQIRDLVQSWLQRQARQVFEERCRHFGEQLGVRCTRISLSSAQTRWGSASASGAIRLNWRLIHFGLATIDYVVAHELAHLREMNHSPRFWEVVRSVMPDYEQAMGRLKSDVLPVFD